MYEDEFDPGTEDDLIHCPECDGEFYGGAEHCPHCGHWITKQDHVRLVRDRRESPVLKWATISVLVLIGLLIILTVIAALI